MKYDAKDVDDYIRQIPEERQPYFEKLRSTILDNIPQGFEECINYNMVGYVVPHKTYPDGYHCNPKDPLPFCNIASQKNFIALYHSGIYSFPDIHDWFVSEYPKYVKRKLDMGKSCVRFKKPEEIPFELIAQLMKKVTVKQWIDRYESVIKK